MSDSGLFLKKKKPRPRTTPTTNHAPAPSASSNPLRGGSSASASPRPPNGSPAAASDPSKIVEFKLLSSGSDNASRYNLMRLNSLRNVDPRAITRPILMNRKEPGPKAPPIFAQDASGKIIGQYVYDNAGKPVLDANGQHVVERKDEKDMTLIGAAPGSSSRRTTRKGVKEVHHQDIEVIRLRREEQTPWILESAKPQNDKEQGAMPEHWVGRMMEPTSMPTVLLVNDGTMGMGFKVMPLGRTYRFEPERPFKVADPETANKNYEQQSKNRFQDKWASREAGPSTGPVSSGRNGVARSNAELWERNITARLMNQMDGPRVKREAFDDDYKREGRLTERGMEGGVDEELDYDFKEEFQDDEENNTFYQDPEEEEEAKAQEEQLKKEFKLANANVGDRPQISSDEEDEEDLFGDKLNQEGKKIRKMMKKRGGVESGYGTSESDDDSDPETVASESKDKKDKDKEKEKERSREPSAAPSDRDRPSRPSSRGPGARVTSSPTGRRHQPPTPGKASTAPPGTGSALLAQRAAAGGASPRHSRQTSPLGRGQSPEKSRAGSPTFASREASPTPSASGATRKPQPRPEHPSKRKTPVHSLSPGPSPNNKRKPSPSPSVSGSGGDASRKKKKSGSNTPTPGPEFDPFPGMITREEVVDWFRRRKQSLVPMHEAIGAFKERIRAAGDRQLDNQKVFLGIVQSLTRSEPEKMLRVREGVL